MPVPTTPEQNAARLKVLQILWGSLVSGVAMFLVITLVIRSGKGEIIVQKDMLDFSSMLVIAGVMMGLLCLLAFFTVPALVVNTQRQALARRAPVDGETTTNDLLPIHQTQFIVGLALLEGGAFLNLVVFLIEGSPVSLGAAIALLLIMATQVPTRSGLDSWVERQGRLLRDEEQTTRAT